jgi:hypothetical protein
MSKDICSESLPNLSRSSQLINSLNCTIRISSSPFRFNLRIKDLSNRNNSKWMWDHCTRNTSNTCNYCFLSVTQIVIGFSWFDLLINYGIDCVSNEEVSQSAIEMSIKTLVETWESNTSFMDLSQNFERIVALLLS